MATKLYKYDETTGGIIEDMFDGAEVGNLIANGGWHPCIEYAKPVEDEPEELVLDGLDLDKLENDDIREVARAAGIDGHDTKRIKTLKEELSEAGV